MNAGWGWRQNNEETVFLTPDSDTGLVGTLVFPGSGDGGFTGGGQIGYNYQFGSFVIGAEADIQGIDNGGNNGTLVFLPGPRVRRQASYPGSLSLIRQTGGALCEFASASQSTGS